MKKWKCEFTLTNDQWIPFNTLRATFIQWFQVRFLHRVDHTNQLFLMNEGVNNVCTFCNSEYKTLVYPLACRKTPTSLLDYAKITLGQQFTLKCSKNEFFGCQLRILHPYFFSFSPGILYLSMGLRKNFQRLMSCYRILNLLYK